MKKVYKLSLVLMFILVSTLITFGQTAKESDKKTDSMISVNNIQTINEGIIVFGVKVNKDGAVTELTVIGDCVTRKASILLLVEKGFAYRLFLKMLIPVKDSPAEISLIMACNQKEKEEIS